MSYDISLYRKGIKEKEIRNYYDYNGNMTYNVYSMLELAFGREHLKKWNDKSCKEFIKDLEAGYIDMIKRPSEYSKHNSDNGWGTYDTTLEIIEKLYKTICAYAESDGLENIYLEFH